jgi:hypothetical protein
MKLEDLAEKAGIRVQHIAYDSADLYKSNVCWGRVTLVIAGLIILIWSL